MYIDDLLLLADDQTTTTSAASTNVIDTLAEGQVGAGMSGAYFYVQVSTAFAVKNGVPITQFQLQTGDTVTFGLSYSNDVTLVQTATYAAASLAAGTTFKIPIPYGCKRYIRGYKKVTNYTAGTDDLSACGYTMAIVKDIDGLITDNEAA